MANRGGYEYESNLRLVSADPGNAITIGSDDKLLVGGNGNGGLTAGPGISLVDQVISALVSGDPGNAVLFGSDDGLYVTPGAAEPPEAGPGIEVTGDQVSTRLSADAGNALSFGSDDGLFISPGAIPDPLLLSDGTQAAPSLAFQNAPDLGFHLLQGDPLGVVGLTGRLEINLPTGQVGLWVSAPATANFIINSGPGNPNYAHHTYQNNGVPRWRIRKGLPTGAGQNDNLEFVRFDDSQTQIVSMRISRASGALALLEPVVAASPLVVDISADADNVLTKGSDNRFFVPTPADPTLTAGNGIAVAGLTISAALSADANNAATFGSDNGIFVPDPAAPTAGNGIAVAGGVISAALSADANNALVFGSDNGLFVPDPAAPDPTTFISADADNALVAGTDSLLFVPTPTPPAAASFISADAGNQIVQGTDNLLLVPETSPQIQGSVATVGDLPASGEVGQYYIVEADGNLYGWTAP